MDPEPAESAFVLLSWIRIRIQEHGNRPNLTNKPDFQPFKKGFVPAKICFMFMFYVYVHVKFYLFLAAKSKTRIQISKDPYWFGLLDETQAWRVCLMLVLCSGSSERGGVGHHYEAAAADSAGSRPGDPGGGGPEHGQVSPCFLVDLSRR